MFHLGQGYWIYVSSDITLPDTGIATDPSQPFLITLQAGWNMVGDPFQTPVSLSELSIVNSSGSSTPFVNALNAGVVSPLYNYDPRQTAGDQPCREGSHDDLILLVAAVVWYGMLAIPGQPATAPPPPQRQQINNDLARLRQMSGLGQSQRHTVEMPEMSVRPRLRGLHRQLPENCSRLNSCDYPTDGE